MPSRAQRLERRRDDLDLLAAEVARLAGVRIQARDEDARPRDAEARAQVAIEDAQRRRESLRA